MCAEMSILIPPVFLGVLNAFRYKVEGVQEPGEKPTRPRWHAYQEEDTYSDRKNLDFLKNVALKLGVEGWIGVRQVEKGSWSKASGGREPSRAGTLPNPQRREQW